MFGICNLSIVPCRREPSDRSEMVTQLLFGDIFEILEANEKWIKIKITYDNYECWIDKKQFQLINRTAFEKISKSSPTLSFDIVSAIKNKDTKNILPIVIGSLLPNFDKNSFAIDKDLWEYEGHTTSPVSNPSKKKIIENAFLFLNAPYLWGGKTPFGIDCSGFTQMVYKLSVSGSKLLRDAYQQAEQGTSLSFVEEAEAGDLAFFDNAEGKITHVGIVLDNNQIIHASGKVRIDKLDHHGIYNTELKKYSHQLRVIKRIL